MIVFRVEPRNAKMQKLRPQNFFCTLKFCKLLAFYLRCQRDERRLQATDRIFKIVIIQCRVGVTNAR